MIIDPLDKTMLLLKSLASQIFSLNVSTNKEMETDYVDNMIAKMAGAFNLSTEEDLGLEADLIGDHPTAEDAVDFGDDDFQIKNPMKKVS